MDKLILKDVRCFRDEHAVELRPLTFLVGENSSGKSTFLAMVRAAHDVRSSIAPDFNEAPFPLGAFDQLAHYHGGKGKRATRFRVGSEESIDIQFGNRARLKGPARVLGVFDAANAQPRLCEWSVSAGPYRIALARDTEGAVSMDVSGPSGRLNLPVDHPQEVFVPDARWVQRGWFALARINKKGGASPPETEPSLSDDDTNALQTLFQAVVLHGFGQHERPVAIAPIRTTPRRTYDPVRDDPTPEGDHIPMVLSNLAASGSARWDEMREALRQFGTDSGLLSDIRVERKGSKSSDPFQLFVSVGRYPFNLVDVGYGVSQILPILVDAFRAPPGTTFLLQQPEVHLHPRAQAALGSFLAKLAVSQGKRFIVETHSDYLIDRVRMELRETERSHLSAASIGLLFFSRVAEHVEITPIEVDESGEVVDPPEDYRQFFMEEQRRLFGLDSVSDS